MTHYVRPIYPKEAKRRHISGVVRLRAVVTAKGDLRDIEVLQGDPILVTAALRAVKQWRYVPTLLNGQAIEVKTQIDVPFNLNQ